MSEPAAVLELDKAEADALHFYMLETLDDWKDYIENEGYEDRPEFMAKREEWPDMVTGILRELSEQLHPGSGEAHTDLEGD